MVAQAETEQFYSKRPMNVFFAREGLIEISCDFFENLVGCNLLSLALACILGNKTTQNLIYSVVHIRQKYTYILNTKFNKPFRPHFKVTYWILEILFPSDNDTTSPRYLRYVQALLSCGPRSPLTAVVWPQPDLHNCDRTMLHID